MHELVSTQHTFYGMLPPAAKGEQSLMNMFRTVGITQCDNQVIPTITSDGKENEAKSHYMNCNTESKHYTVGPIKILGAGIDYTPEDEDPNRKCELKLEVTDADHISDRSIFSHSAGRVSCTCWWPCGSADMSHTEKTSCPCKGYRQEESANSFVLEGAASGSLDIEASPISDSGQFSISLRMNTSFPMGLSTFPERGLQVEPCVHMDTFNRLNPKENSCQMLEKTAVMTLTEKLFAIDTFWPIRIDNYTRRYTLQSPGVNLTVVDMCPGGAGCA